MSSRVFRKIPSCVKRTWSLREITTTMTPGSSELQNITYESPIRSIELKATFLSEQQLGDLIYAKPDESFANEWEFATDEWEQLIDAVTDAVSAYNKKIIQRTKDYTLTSATVIGRASTSVGENPDRSPVQETRTSYQQGNNQIQTIYEPSIRSTTTRKSSSVKLSPMQMWLTGRRYH